MSLFYSLNYMRYQDYNWKDHPGESQETQKRNIVELFIEHKIVFLHI